MQTLLSLDRQLLLFFNAREWPAWLDAVFVFITEDEPLRIPLLLLWLFILLAGGPRWRRRALWLLPLIALSDSSASQVLKELFGRLRPCQADIAGLRVLVDCGPAFSFPSSHAANMGAVGTWLALGARRRRWRALILLLPVLVSHSRVHVGVHYPLDVMAGWCWGMGLAMAMQALTLRLPRFGIRVPVREVAEDAAEDQR